MALEPSHIRKLFTFLVKQDKKTLTFKEFRENCHARDGQKYLVLHAFIQNNVLRFDGSKLVLAMLGEFIFDEYLEYKNEKPKTDPYDVSPK